MYETAHYPMFRNDSYLRALNLYNNNPRNFEKEIKEKPIINEISKTNQDKINYHIKDNALGEGTPKEKSKEKY